MAPMPQVPPEKKKEALDRLVAGRLLSQDARSRGLDNTEEYRETMRQNEQGIWITALYRKELETKARIDDKDVQSEAKKLRDADKNLAEGDAMLRATQMISDNQTRKIEGDLIAAAKKETTSSIDKELLQKIGKGEKVDDPAIVAAAGAEKISYGEAKRLLASLAPGPHGGEGLARNPMALEKVLDREVTGRVLVAYARKQGIEGSEWMKKVRGDLERSILINLLADKVVPKEVTVTSKEIRDAYDEHAQMFIRDGKKTPFVQVKEQIRAYLHNNKRRKALETYIEGLKKKGKITINEGVLSKV